MSHKVRSPQTRGGGREEAGQRSHQVPSLGLQVADTDQKGSLAQF